MHLSPSSWNLAPSDAMALYTTLESPELLEHAQGSLMSPLGSASDGFVPKVGPSPRASPARS